MHNAAAGEQKRAAARVEIATILARYPDTSAEETDMLIRYFRKEASSLDVALLSIDEVSIAGYRRFELDHSSRLHSGVQDAIIVGIITVLLAISIVLLWDVGR